VSSHVFKFYRNRVARDTTLSSDDHYWFNLQDYIVVLYVYFFVVVIEYGSDVLVCIEL
jgi:hypothetical protein